VELGTDEEKQSAERAQAAKEVELKDVLNAIRVVLQDDVKEVRLSKRLTSSAACLVSEEGDISPQMAKMMAAMGQPVPKVKRIFELNGAHAVMEKMQKLFTADAQHPLLKDYARLLYGQSILAEGGQIDDPTAFNNALLEVMVKGPAA
jgi:molecular chaperone HtpG